MASVPSLESIVKRALRDLVEGSKAMNDIKTEHFIPILSYVTIDSLAWLVAARENVTRTDFIEWTEKYLVGSGKLGGARGIDLYAARCGLLHTQTPESKLASEGRARKIIYFGKIDREFEVRDPEGNLAVCINCLELVEAILHGGWAFLRDLNGESEQTRSRAHTRALQRFQRVAAPGQ